MIFLPTQLLFLSWPNLALPFFPRWLSAPFFSPRLSPHPSSSLAYHSFSATNLLLFCFDPEKPLRLILIGNYVCSQDFHGTIILLLPYLNMWLHLTGSGWHYAIIHKTEKFNFSLSFCKCHSTFDPCLWWLFLFFMVTLWMSPYWQNFVAFLFNYFLLQNFLLI